MDAVSKGEITQNRSEQTNFYVVYEDKLSKLMCQAACKKKNCCKEILPYTEASIRFTGSVNALE